MPTEQQDKTCCWQNCADTETFPVMVSNRKVCTSCHTHHEQVLPLCQEHRYMGLIHNACHNLASAVLGLENTTLRFKPM